MHHLVEVIKTKFPTLHSFSEELHTVEYATKISSETLAADIQDMRKGLDFTKLERDEQPTNQSILEFYKNASISVQEIGEKNRKMMDCYKRVCAMFCEDSRKINFEDLFASYGDSIATKKFYNKNQDNYDEVCNRKLPFFYFLYLLVFFNQIVDSIIPPPFV